MSCYISSGVDLGCSDGIGGIKSIWVLGASGATAPDVTAVAVTGTTGPITGITGSGVWYNFELKRNTSSLSQNPVASELDGDSIDSAVQNALTENALNQNKKTQILTPVQPLTPIENAVNETIKRNNE